MSIKITLSVHRSQGERERPQSHSERKCCDRRFGDCCCVCDKMKKCSFTKTEGVHGGSCRNLYHSFACPVPFAKTCLITWIHDFVVYITNPVCITKSTYNSVSSHRVDMMVSGWKKQLRAKQDTHG